MPPLETKDRLTRVVVWDAILVRDNYGEVRVRPPRELYVRWVDKAAEAIDATGNTVRIDAQMAAAESIPMNSIVFKGTLAESNNTNAQVLMKIITTDEEPDLKGRHTRYEYKMIRFKDSLPTIVGGP